MISNNTSNNRLPGKSKYGITPNMKDIIIEELQYHSHNCKNSYQCDKS